MGGSSVKTLLDNIEKWPGRFDLFIGRYVLPVVEGKTKAVSLFEAVLAIRGLYQEKANVEEESSYTSWITSGFGLWKPSEEDKKKDAELNLVRESQINHMEALAKHLAHELGGANPDSAMMVVLGALVYRLARFEYTHDLKKLYTCICNALKVSEHNPMDDLTALQALEAYQNYLLLEEQYKKYPYITEYKYGASEYLKEVEARRKDLSEKTEPWRARKQELNCLAELCTSVSSIFDNLIEKLNGKTYQHAAELAGDDAFNHTLTEDERQILQGFLQKLSDKVSLKELSFQKLIKELGLMQENTIHGILFLAQKPVKKQGQYANDFQKTIEETFKPSRMTSDVLHRVKHRASNALDIVQPVLEHMNIDWGIWETHRNFEQKRTEFVHQVGIAERERIEEERKNASHLASTF